MEKFRYQNDSDYEDNFRQWRELNNTEKIQFNEKPYTLIDARKVFYKMYWRAAWRELNNAEKIQFVEKCVAEKELDKSFANILDIRRILRMEDESWMHQIRKLAPLIEKTERELFRCEAEVKKLCATLKLTALGEGRKTSSAQDTWAEAQPELFDARIKVGVIKGALSSLKVQLKAIEIGFEEWRTKVVNAREERKRYGA